ncbi:hypothetical protein LSTR_LSTR004842 [Laodelphax striatellus]|uniref:HAP1 N-terminal domain-containing protein n=1 Tax=Laodelphax striatellus TaxID=195883 RepID=A0A482WIU9_LAOST|nr:hypothetical protein LSTR_LSTR004842 [Laodelphax striatellus]
MYAVKNRNQELFHDGMMRKGKMKPKYDLEDYIYDVESRSLEPSADPEDVYAQLQQKEQDLMLAAELGKALLEKNEELSRQNERLAEEYSQKLEITRELNNISTPILSADYELIDSFFATKYSKTEGSKFVAWLAGLWMQHEGYFVLVSRCRCEGRSRPSLPCVTRYAFCLRCDANQLAAYCEINFSPLFSSFLFNLKRSKNSEERRLPGFCPVLLSQVKH